MTVSMEDITSGKGNFFVRDANVVTQADNAGERKLGVNEFTVMLDPFRFAFD